MFNGILDLSIVTDQLVSRLTNFASGFAPLTVNPFGLKFTGLAPDAARQGMDVDCIVSVYLFHVAADKFHRNTYPTGGVAQLIPEQPLALTLYYLVTAYSPASHSNEQRAMSVVLKCFHEKPISKLDTVIEEFTLTLEPQTIDEMGRLWQSISSAMRFSAVYRASVIFIRPPDRTPPDVVRHTPTFDPPHDIKPLEVVPGPPLLAADADGTGFAEIAIANPDFAATVTTAQLRALGLLETTTTTYPLAARHFYVKDARTLQLRVPLFTPAGEYLLTVRPAADKPALGYVLTVPELVVTVPADNPGFAMVAIDDAHFSATSTLELQTLPLPAPAVPLAFTAVDPPGPGQFHVVDDNTVLLRVPTGTHGRHRLRVVPTPGKQLDLTLDVP